MIQNLPIIPERLRELLTDLERWTQKIIDNDAQTASAIADVKQGLQSGDVARLKGHTVELQNVSNSLSGLVANTK